MPKSPYARLLRQLVIGNRVLARYDVLDSFGHVSVRHPEHPEQFVMSRARAPELVTEEDLQTYNLEGHELTGDTRGPYTERFIHGAIYEARPEVQAVCHNHSPAVIPFGTTDVKLRPLYHVAGAIANGDHERRPGTVPQRSRGGRHRPQSTAARGQLAWRSARLGSLVRPGGHERGGLRNGR